MLTAAPWATTTAARTRAARLTATPSRRRAARRTIRAARAARRTAAKAWRKGSAPASGAQQSRVCCGSRLAEEILKTAAAQDEQHHDLRQPEGPGRGPRGIRSWLPLVRKTKPALKRVVVVSTVVAGRDCESTAQVWQSVSPCHALWRRRARSHRLALVRCSART